MVVVSSMMHYTIHYSFVLHTSTFVVQNWTPPVHFFQYRPGLTQHTFFSSTDLASSSTLFQYRPWLFQYTCFSTDLDSASTQVYLQYTFASPSTKNKNLSSFAHKHKTRNKKSIRPPKKSFYKLIGQGNYFLRSTKSQLNKPSRPRAQAPFANLFCCAIW